MNYQCVFERLFSNLSILRDSFSMGKNISANHLMVLKLFLQTKPFQTEFISIIFAAYNEKESAK